MKRLIAMVLVLGIGVLSGNIFAQGTRDKKTQDAKKGGFAVGGFDASRQSKEVKRSVNINEEAEVSQKSMEEIPPVPVPEAAPAAAPPPASRKTIKAKKTDIKEGDRGNAYGKDKQKRKKDPGSKGEGK